MKPRHLKWFHNIAGDYTRFTKHSSGQTIVFGLFFS